MFDKRSENRDLLLDRLTKLSPADSNVAGCRLDLEQKLMSILVNELFAWSRGS